MNPFVNQAIKALIYEVILSPKPGLVDAFDSGAHHDMDIYTFIDSSFSLQASFGKYYHAGFTHTGSEKELFHLIREVGKEAENIMLQATGHVNTHKGANFSFGVVLAAMGACHQANAYELETIIIYIKKMTMGLVQSELQDSSSTKTHGEKIFKRFGITGVRGEVENGFPLIFNYALPYLKSHSDVSLTERLLRTLLLIMSKNDDTNILSRGSMQDLLFIKEESTRLLNLPSPALWMGLEAFSVKCNALNLSPGGSADLLALTIFFGFYTKILSIEVDSEKSDTKKHIQ